MKRIITMILAFCLILGLSIALVSCGGDNASNTDDNAQNGNDNTTDGENSNGDDDDDDVAYVDYTVTFVDYQGISVEGITFELTYGENKSEQVTSGANGKGVAKVREDNLEYVYVNVLECEGYGVPTKKNFNRFGFDEKEIEITLLPEVKVTVLDGDGNPVEYVGVQICYGSVCRQAAPTDENGVLLSYFIPEGDIKIKISEDDTPDGYVTPEADAEGYCAYFEEGELELTFVLEKE